MLHLAIFYGLLLSICGYALVRGGRPEQAVAMVMLAGVAASMLVASPAATRFFHTEWGIFAVDCAVLVAFTVIALKADRFWPMVVVMLHTMSIIAHVLKVANPDLIRIAYRTQLSLWFYPQIVLLAVGTWRHVRRKGARGTDRSWSTFSLR